MRKRIVLASAAVLLGTVLLASVNFLAKHNKAFFIGRAEQAFGRKISVGQIRVTFWPFGARLQDLALANDPAFPAEDFIRAKELRIELRLLPLFMGELRPKRIMLESPIVTLVRDPGGRYNLGRRDRKKKISRDGTDESARHPTGWNIEQLFLLPAFAVAGGTLRYRDLAGGELTASRINLKVRGFDSDQTLEIDLDAAVNTAESNLKLRSRIGPIEKSRDFRDTRLDGEINATDLDLGKVNKALPRLRKALPKALRFDGIYTIKELKFKGTLNNLSLKGAVTGTDAAFRFE